MIKYVGKRLALMVLVLLGVAFIVYAIISMTPGSPARMMLGAKASQEAVDALNAQLGYDKPFLIQFGNYIWNIITEFDFGRSYRSGQPVVTEFFACFPYTFRLAVAATILSCLIGIPLGILSAVKQYSLVDAASTTAAMVLSAVPSFWLGMIFIDTFALHMKILPTSGVGTPNHYILPVLTLGLIFASELLRLTRSSMLETIRQDYIRTARAKGANERIVIWKHALKNALLPVLTAAGVIFGQLLGGAILCESVFVMPGVGMYLLTAIQNKDVPVILSGTVFVACMFSVVILIVDLLYAFIDPRIKAKYAKGKLK
ncbi:MAG: ABC transporter permease [Anaerovoracaceae bacterium]